MLFHKKANEDSVAQTLEKTDLSSFKDPTQLNKLVKSVIEGNECLMRCHLVKCDDSLGRSTVIDLGAKGDNQFRQVDHRTIEYIIIRNVKYLLKKGAKKPVQDDDMAAVKNEPKWDVGKLAVGNWFSGTRYFRSVEKNGDQIKMRSEQ